MPKEAKIFLVEDNEGYRKVLARFLTMEGHVVFSQAGSLEEALNMITRLLAKDVDILLTDGNLSELSSDGIDGASIAKKFRKKFPNKPVLSISLDRQTWSDDQSISKKSGPIAIAKRVTTL